tara:strand:- start:827 stop:1120 length:294 start_codon:yes stop_codon:yes gene_type:complete
LPSQSPAPLSLAGVVKAVPYVPSVDFEHRHAPVLFHSKVFDARLANFELSHVYFLSHHGWLISFRELQVWMKVLNVQIPFKLTFLDEFTMNSKIPKV